MKKILLIRSADTPWGTFGKLMVPGHAPFHTLELPWRGNRPNVSCIPTGEHEMRLLPSATLNRITKGRFSKAWYLLNIKQRTGILIHPGNFMNDSQGCILVGTGVELINGYPGVVRSQMAYAALACALSNDPPESMLITWANNQPLSEV